MAEKRNSTLWAILIFSIIVIILIGGIYIYVSKSKDILSFFSSKTINGVTMSTTFYDRLGNEISPSTAQTIVGGRAGISYLSFSILVSNTGNVPLTNVTIKESHPSDFANAIQSPIILQNLSVGSQNVLLFDTANVCVSNSDCASNEKCIGTPLKCKIDISNYVGDITYGTTIEASYKDAQGINKVTSTLINIAYHFEQENILLRFEKPKETTFNGFTNSWLSFDSNGDEILEGWGGSSTVSSGGGTNCLPSSDTRFISNYGNYIVQKSTDLTKIYMCQEKGITDDYVIFTKTDTDSARAIINPIPTEPYASQNCGGVTPCQELYSTVITPPQSSCSDSIKNQDETDVDCGGSVCSACSDNLVCSINSDCVSGNCTGSVCSASGGMPSQNIFVNFRTAKTQLSNLDGTSNDAIAWSSSCGGVLTKAGEYSNIGGSGTSGATCQAYMTGNSWVKVIDIPTGLSSVTRGSFTANSNFALWQKGSDYSICADNPRPVYLGFRESSCSFTACTDLSISSAIVDAGKEATCQA